VRTARLWFRDDGGGIRVVFSIIWHKWLPGPGRLLKELFGDRAGSGNWQHQIDIACAQSGLLPTADTSWRLIFLAIYSRRHFFSCAHRCLVGLAEKTGNFGPGTGARPAPKGWTRPQRGGGSAKLTARQRSDLCFWTMVGEPHLTGFRDQRDTPMWDGCRSWFLFEKVLF